MRSVLLQSKDIEDAILSESAKNVPEQHIELAKKLVEKRLAKKIYDPNDFKIGSGWAGSRVKVDQDGLSVE